MGKMKVYLSPSGQVHNEYATQGTVESVQCHRIAVQAKAHLEANGFDVMLGPEGQSYVQNVANSNAWGANLHICIHTNAGGSGDGTLGLAWSGSVNDKYMVSIYNEVAAISPGSDEGIKVRTDLYEINQTKAPCAYIECEYHDKASLSEFIIANVEAFGAAIARGVSKAYDGTFNGSAPQPVSISTHKVSSGYSGGSIVEYLNSIGADSSYNHRRDLAHSMGIAAYSGTASQNTLLLNKLRSSNTALKPAQSSQSASYEVGRTYTVRVSNLNVRTGPGTGYAKKAKSQLTVDGQNHSNGAGQYGIGTVVTCRETTVVGGNTWMRTPSGWLCAVCSGVTYIS